ncbi:hypothetical protein D3C80_1203390 [compost metagenome]
MDEQCLRPHGGGGDTDDGVAFGARHTSPLGQLQRSLANAGHLGIEVDRLMGEGWCTFSVWNGDGGQPAFQQHAVDQGFVPVGGVVERDQVDHGQLVRLVRAEFVPQHLGVDASGRGDLADHVVGFKSAACRFEVRVFAVATDKHGSRSIECHSNQEVAGR